MKRRFKIAYFYKTYNSVLMIKVLSKILKSNKIQVVGIYEDSDSLKINILTLKKEKNKLII